MDGRSEGSESDWRRGIHALPEQLPLSGKQASSLPRCNRPARRRVCVRVPLRSPKGTALPGTGENRQYKRSRRLWRSFASPFPGSDPAEMRAFRVDLRIVQKNSCFSRLNGGGCSHGRTALWPRPKFPDNREICRDLRHYPASSF
jgi:hypothetical protein